MNSWLLIVWPSLLPIETYWGRHSSSVLLRSDSSKLRLCQQLYNIICVLSGIMTALENWYLRNISRLEGRIDYIVKSPCHIWSGRPNEYGYGRFTYTSFLGGKQVETTVHRAYYMLVNRVSMEPTGTVPYLQASHLCHTKTCVNLNHINMEPRALNSQRNTCKRNKKCTGHVVFPDCIGYGEWLPLLVMMFI